MEAEGIVIADCEGADRARLHARATNLHELTGQRILISSHELGRPWQAGQGRSLETKPTEIPSRLAMSIKQALHEFRWTAHHTRSHSFASVISPGGSVASAVMITILPVLSISIRAICTPAAVTALTALVTSCCRNVEGARAMMTTAKSAYEGSW